MLSRVIAEVRRHWRAIAGIGAAVVAIAVAAPLVGGWYFSNRLESDALHVWHKPPSYSLRVVAVGDGTVTLEPAASEETSGTWRLPGTWGLEWSGGYAQVGAIRKVSEGRVVRDLTIFEGSLQPGARARIDVYAFPGDPMLALGLPFEDVVVRGPLGELPAWFVPGEGGHWAILVHGHGATRRDSLRMLKPLHDAGFNVLMITYRNDEGVAADPDGRYRFGLGEWEDLDAAARWALDRGASRLLLCGNSMGGAIIMSFMRESARAPEVDRLILDSPMLDFDATVRWEAPGYAPGLLISVAERVSSARFGLRWGRLNYLKDANQLRVPVLLFHGDDDEKVPFATSLELARLRPDIVTFVPVAGAGHVRAWNVDPRAYEDAMGAFLREVGGKSAR